MFALLGGTCVTAEINPPIGPYVNLKAEDFTQATSFTANDRVVLTPYFYWYDVYAGAHITDSDGTDALTDHPPTLTGFSYKSAAWHRGELLDMAAAGIDVLLPVYWGEPSQRLAGQPVSAQPWSFSGLPPLVQAREELLAQGKQSPRIGMFYDTSTLQWNAANRRIDLTTEEGRQWFYESMRDFFSLIPPKHWAMIDGQPIVFLYAAGFAAAHDQSAIDYARQAFARDFAGRVPFVVREISWQVQSENVYAWGGALGLKNPGVASLGPGYDHSAVPGREPLIVPREEGAFFERNWIRFLRNPSKFVMIETWNEYHEGTDIAASREYGRKYIELNRQYVDLFKQEVKPPRPRGSYSDVKSVSVTLQATNEARGLVQFESADGATAPAEAGGQPCRAIAPTIHPGRYIYFHIDDSFKWADRMLVDVEVHYFDSGSGSFRFEYDGSDPNAPFQGAYTSSKTSVSLGNSGQWKVARFRLIDARFLNSQNGGADFRLAVLAPTLYVSRVIVTRLGLPTEAGQRLRGWQDDFVGPVDATWMVVNDAGGSFSHSDGLLRINGSPGRSALLFANLPDPAPTSSEILARVRPVTAGPGQDWFGGLAAAINPNTAEGPVSVLRSDAGGARGLAQLWLGQNAPSPGPGVSVAWKTNRWYWFRLRHQTNSITGFPDLWVRLWSADGETAEPDSWTSWWDYYPARAVAHGLPGFVAGSSGAFECDYFLVKSESLPETTIQLPALKPARTWLQPAGYSPGAGMEIELQGAAEATYFIESTSDFNDWTSSSVLTDASGAARFHDPAAANLPRRFYRARAMP
ncbi:MAG: DUF5010 domain-containing protein [Chloroflexi bacterium]|nr:DUF5010 domain-containing protein [Chloroflexota bacterium]